MLAGQANGAATGSDSFFDIDVVIGSPKADTINGDDKDNVLRGSTGPTSSTVAVARTR